ncbi:hypothetical protein RJ639_023342 [Escallonia herrerae]|uniref:SCP domain-containing protein n=1 Tax=Escallonia herrerae TaxID=1293975 RepID=A0AA88UZH7_9ASTE|nr:hypothetical protein RJ639_023342 [Escallonia herrerae]
MWLPKISLAIVYIMSITMCGHSVAQSSPEDFLYPHNKARAQVGVQPLAWNYTIAAYAQHYANHRFADCNLEHSGGPYGENLAEGYGELKAADAVSMWVGEKPNYDYHSNSCVGDECLHYTQVVWRDSVHLGCARVPCRNGWVFVICSYDPPGNYEDYVLCEIANYQEYFSDVQNYFKATRSLHQNSSTLILLREQILAPTKLPRRAQVHNAARVEVGVGNLTWDNALAAHVQSYASERTRDCMLKLSKDGKHGENATFRSGDVMTAMDAVALWMQEKLYYDYKQNACEPYRECDHYIQLVWCNSTRLGCAAATTGCSKGYFYVACNYDPPAKLDGKQRPY